MSGADVAKWAWFGEPIKDLVTGIAGIVTMLRVGLPRRRRFDVSPMSESWLRDNERQTSQHREYP